MRGNEFIIVLMIGVVVWYLMRGGPSRKRKQAAKQAAEQAAVRAESERLVEIRKTMTNAEWQAFLLQYENQKLLKQIIDSQNAPRFGIGFISGM